MADTTLGVLRRAPRPVEQRTERIARWRAQGLANGAADSTFPGDATDGAVFSGGAGGDSEAVQTSVRWYGERFVVGPSSTGVLTLTYQPQEWSEVVSYNGIRLDPISEYAIDGRTLTLTDVADLTLGVTGTNYLVINYAITDIATPMVEDAILALGPWGYWKLNEPSTMVVTDDVVDYSGNNRHGQYGVTPPSGLDTAPFLSGLSHGTTYNGGDDAVQVDHAQTGFDAGFTITAWVKPADTTGNRAVVGSTYEGDITLFKLCCHDGVWRCESYWDGTFQQPVGGTATVGTPQWVVARYDGDVTLELFLDNTLIDTATCTAPLPTGLSQSYLRLAARGDGTVAEQYDGTISDIAIWDRALTDDEMASIWAAGGVA